MQTQTHAKNRFLRRIQNRRLGKGNPDFGKPITGVMTEAEIARKQRRKAARHFNLQRRIKDTEYSIQKLTEEHNLLAGASGNDKREKDEIQKIKSKMRELSYSIDKRNEELSRLKKSFSVLH